MIKSGIAASKGYAIGKVFIQEHEEIVINDNKISDVNYVLSDVDFNDGYAILKKGKKVFYKLV